MKITTSLLAAILICGCADATPATNAPAAKHDGPIISGRIAKLHIVSRKMGEKRWNFVLTDVKTVQDSPALQAQLKRNDGRFITMVEEPYQLFRYRGNYVGSLVGEDCKVYLDGNFNVIKTEGKWQIPGKEGKYIPGDAQQ